MWLQCFTIRYTARHITGYPGLRSNYKLNDNRKSPSSCKSTSSEIKAHEVQASPKRLVTVAKLPVELLEDHFAEQLKRLASKELAVYMCSRNHVTAMCDPSLIQRLHIRRYPGLSFKYEIHEPGSCTEVLFLRMSFRECNILCKRLRLWIKHERRDAGVETQRAMIGPLQFGH